jgi:predicted ribosome quality control (RQC) complex YloA/Tae2 family protein
MKIVDEVYILGQNAQDNWDILDKAEGTDYFFHLTSFPSCYVIFKCLDIPTNENIIKAAQICKENTKYRNLKNLRVDYCPCSNIKKGENIGEVIFHSLRKVKNIKI